MFGYLFLRLPLLIHMDWQYLADPLLLKPTPADSHSYRARFVVKRSLSSST